MQRVNIEISLPVYDGFIKECGESSREYEVLKNGLILERKTENHFERFIRIECSLEDARKLLLLAVKMCPDVVGDIARGITAVLNSD